MEPIIYYPGKHFNFQIEALKEDQVIRSEGEFAT